MNAQQKAWQNAGLTLGNINFCFAIVLQLSGRRNSSQQKFLS
jgi:hypothetical protein